MKFKNTYILSLGGSLVSPDKIDTGYLKKFRQFVLEEVHKGNRLIIVCGGGSTARKYRDAGRTVIKHMTVDDLDWLGIHATRLNAHLIRTIFRDLAYPKLTVHPRVKYKTDAPVIIGAGYHPGCSTDYVAVLLAETYGATKVINLSNIDYVYDRNPKKYKNAKKIKEITWKDFRKIVGNKWDPGLHAPFDPIASKEAQRIGLEVVVADGKNLKNLDAIIQNKPFIGTVIKGE